VGVVQMKMNERNELTRPLRTNVLSLISHFFDFMIGSFLQSAGIVQYAGDQGPAVR
jgi:hypothetical protein